eukprot:CAMPEP_0117470840 /NCGR_PEP_ID=MMETSP0784-20121206/7424_1 /TAXON_ID=39447 /ORGANISM="" /LENGTH=597 /DNA_ID=CAMNT_0005264943 /DNA_START=42 /DNA_END=1832 /DNA_ORIENTATION=-
MANFLDETATGSRDTWRDVCKRQSPQVGPNGYLTGPWADAIVAAVACEKAGQAGRFSDGPAGQVLDYLQHRGHQKLMKAAEATEEAAHAGRLRPPSSASKPQEGASRPECRYGASCYNRDPEHLKKFSHPYGGGYPGAAAAAPSAPPRPNPSAAAPRPVCKYGAKCYNKNPEHLNSFAHPWLEGGGAACGASAGPAALKIRCGKCSKVLEARIPPSAAAGSPIRVPCPDCRSLNEAKVPQSCVGGKGGKGGAGGAHRTDLARPAPRIGGRPPRVSGRQRALLIGVNYFGTRAELRGCINDVHNMQRLLTESFGWSSRDIRTLTDDGRGRDMPTRSNIMDGLRWLAGSAAPGDVLFFHFSGHGAQQEDPNGFEEDGMNETICPMDFKNAGMITDDEIGDIIVKPLPEGVKLIGIMDCCHSGTGLDLPFTWTRHGWKEETNPYHSLCDVQMFSGCEDDDTSSDASTAYGAAGGAMTTAFCDVLRQNSCPTYPQLLDMLHNNLRRRGFSQRPQLTSSQQFSFDRPFVISDILPNTNPEIGRTVRRRFPPQPRKMDPSDPLAMMLGVGAGLLGGMLVADVVGDVLGGGGFGAPLLGGLLDG